jgi:SAM-dependent methyltransferase
MKKSLQKLLLGPARDVGATNESARDEWIAAQLKALPKGARLLDAGAGKRPYEKHCSHLKYVSQDFGEYDGKGDSTGLQIGDWAKSWDIVCDILRVPEPDESFDAVLCTEVLEHLPQPRAAVVELSRLLKPSGKLIVTAPFCSLTHFAPFHFATGFSRYFYEDVFKEANLRVLELVPNGNYFEFLAQELRRLPSVAGQYSSGSSTLATKLQVGALLRTLKRCSSADKGSHELLCYGYFAVGVKNPRRAAA